MDKIKDAQLILDAIGNTYSGIIGFFKTLFTNPIQLVRSFQGIAPGIILVILTIILILRFIGFKNLDKWAVLTLVIAAIISTL